MEEVTAKQGFVQKIRKIRDEINSEIMNMDSKQIRNYYKKLMSEIAEKKKQRP